MRVCNFASGSKGNCTYVEGGDAKLIIDIGVTARYVVECLDEMGVNPAAIDAILITHEHSDHIKGVLTFAKKYSTKILCAEVWKGVLQTQLIGCEHLISSYASDFRYHMIAWHVLVIV